MPMLVFFTCVTHGSNPTQKSIQVAVMIVIAGKEKERANLTTGKDKK